jgi:hypothetical protein
MRNHSEAIEDLERNGWKPYHMGYPRAKRWMFHRTNRYDYFTDYCTVFGSGRVVPGIYERGIRRATGAKKQ